MKKTVICFLFSTLGAVILLESFLDADDNSHLVLEIALDKNVALVCEPVFVKVELRNNGEDEIEVRRGLFDEYDPRLFVSVGDDGEYQPFLRAFGPDEGLGIGVRATPPGMSITYEDMLLCDFATGKFGFGEPGKYKIFAELSKKHGVRLDGGEYLPLNLKSNIVKFEIVQPKGRDSKALRLFQSLKVTRLSDMFSDGRADQEDIRLLKKLVSKYPDTIYAKYAYCFLGRVEIISLEGRPKPIDIKLYDRPIKYFERFLARSRGERNIMVERALWDLGECYAKVGQGERTKRCETKLATLFPRGKLGSKAKRSIERARAQQEIRELEERLRERCKTGSSTLKDQISLELESLKPLPRVNFLKNIEAIAAKARKNAEYCGILKELCLDTKARRKIRSVALTVLVSVDPDFSFNVCSKILQEVEPEEGLVLLAVSSLSKIGGERSERLLVAFLINPQKVIRSYEETTILEAIWALQKIGGIASKEVLKKYTGRLYEGVVVPQLMRGEALKAIDIIQKKATSGQ